ncbi:signal peptidase I [Halodesulfurarchaeum sp.]|uniref:signal peptidase I n=1 Tax=Halodesulfurarchaeum sp. TaxID=1980530 RepID=UPI002FC3AC22
MNGRRLVRLSVEVLVAGAILALVVGQVTGTPMLLGYVESGSMAPTMEKGDGFIAVPAAISGGVDNGDVVTFRAEELQGGGLTTHRVVGESDRGYITRGDANPFTDQDGAEPPVKDAQIVAQALQVNGNVVVIPHLGTAVVSIQEVFTSVQHRLAAITGMRSFLGGQGIAYLLLGLSIAFYIVDLLLEDSAKDRTRSRERDDGIDENLILAAVALVVVVSATVAMTVPAGTQSFGVVSAEFESERPTVIPSGETSTIDYRVPNSGVVPTHVYIEPASEGVSVAETHHFVPGRGKAMTTITLEAPPETGYYRRFIAEHRYLGFLPEPVIRTLYSVHPWLPIIGINGLLAGVIFILGKGFLQGSRVRLRSRSRSHHRGMFRHVYDIVTGRD